MRDITLSLKENILDLLKKKRTYYTRHDLRKIMEIKGEELTAQFDEVMEELESDGYIFLEKNKGYTLFEYNRRNMAFGKLDIGTNGFGYVHTKDGHKIIIDKRDLNNALNGDNVIVSNITGNHGKYRGEIFKIVKRGNPKAYFKVVGNGTKASLVPYNSIYNIPVDIDKNKLKDLVDGQIIEIEIPIAASYGTFEGSFVKVIGHESDASLDLKVMAAELGIDSEFTPEEIAEAESLPNEVREEDIKGRVDLRHKKFLTIDCDNTKDRDDAVAIELLPNGNYKLYVSIASVNHYVKMGSALFEGILRRCTSHYPNNMVMPMLPHKISNGICSLNEDVDRLTKTCEMEIDKNGHVVDYEIYNSVIKSRKAMAYSKVNSLLEGEEVPEYEDFKSELTLMQELSEVLNKASERRKYLEFDIPEIEVKKVDGVNVFDERKPGKAEKLIENFMVITDNTVASHYSFLPFIYRTHDLPNEDFVRETVKRIKLAGGNPPNPSVVDATYIKKLLLSIKDDENLRPFNTLLLRAMAKAKYSIINNGHYALQLDNYCHFTSPIRRAADFIVHTVIDEAESHNYDQKYLEALEEELFKIAGKASNEEIKDKQFEAEAKKLAMAEYMQDHIGEISNARIINLLDKNIIVRTDSLIDGKISISDISKGAYYDPDIDAVVVPSSKDLYRIGNMVEVRTKAASKENRSVEFTLVRRKKANS